VIASVLQLCGPCMLDVVRRARASACDVLVTLGDVF